MGWAAGHGSDRIATFAQEKDARVTNTGNIGALSIVTVVANPMNSGTIDNIGCYIT